MVYRLTNSSIARRVFCLASVGFMVLLWPVISSAQVLEIREGSGFPAEVRSIYAKGADYLARTQKDDGHWGQGAQFHGNETNGVCALAVMAFLSTGEDPNFGKYANNIRKAIRYIIKHQNPKSGYIPGNMYVHGFAMLALSEAYAAVDDEMLWAGFDKEDGKTRTIGEALELAVRLAVDSQKKNQHGGWRYGPGDPSADTSIVGAVLMGLLAARNAGIEVPDKTVDKALDYMKGMTSDSGQVGYSGLGGFGDSMARSSIACLVFAIGKRKHWDEFEATKKYVAKDLQAAESSWVYYTRYYRAQALFQADYDAWKKWNRETIRRMRENQSESGQIGRSDHGPAYSTSMSLLALALNFRFLPIYER